MVYDRYYRFGEYDLWIKETGDYRVECYRGGDNGYAVWKGRFSGSEIIESVTNCLRLEHRRGDFYFSYSLNQGGLCRCELSVPRWFIGKKIIHGNLSLAQSKQLFNHLEKI